MADLNGVMMQYFHWHPSGGSTLWDEVRRNASQLAEVGFTALWLPPAYKRAIATSPATDPNEYDTYDLFDLFDLGDLGESDATAPPPTKPENIYGTRQQYLDAIKAI
ncbi:MAG: hypothetical protein HC925_05050, partial [Coleofasciculaceae cyanobacterium SM2_3_26]|nr:hypothetical protein [Coleofasciculaceae cyanobacterium SM2_3_26]